MNTIDIIFKWIGIITVAHYFKIMMVFLIRHFKLDRYRFFATGDKEDETKN